MGSTLSLAKISAAKPGKLRCGDYCDYVILEDEQLIVLALADGVGSCACDWKASQVSVIEFLKSFENNRITNIEERFESAICYADQIVTSEQDLCSGMKSTFVGVVWDIANNKIHYTSFGDSRIYLFSSNKIIQLTEDDSKAIIKRRNDGKPFLVAGSAVIEIGITNAMGILSGLRIKTNDDADMDGIILMSDGVYNYMNDFEDQLINSFNHLELDDPVLNTMHQRMSSEQNDDFSVVLCRRNILSNDFSIDEIINSSKPLYYLGLKVVEKLTEAIKAKDGAESLKLSGLFIEHDINLSKSRINALITEMKQNNFLHGPTYQNLIKILRKT